MTITTTTPATRLPDGRMHCGVATQGKHLPNDDELATGQWHVDNVCTDRSPGPEITTRQFMTIFRQFRYCHWLGASFIEFRRRSAGNKSYSRPSMAPAPGSFCNFKLRKPYQIHSRLAHRGYRMINALICRVGHQTMSNWGNFLVLNLQRESTAADGRNP